MKINTYKTFFCILHCLSIMERDHFASIRTSGINFYYIAQTQIIRTQISRPQCTAKFKGSLYKFRKTCLNFDKNSTNTNCTRYGVKLFFWICTNSLQMIIKSYLLSILVLATNYIANSIFIKMGDNYFISKVLHNLLPVKKYLPCEVLEIIDCITIS